MAPNHVVKYWWNYPRTSHQVISAISRRAEHHIRVIESIESLVRIHNAQEEDIYEHAIAG